MMHPNFPVRLIHTTFWLAPTLMLLADLTALVFGHSYFWLSTHFFWLSFYAFLGVIIGMLQLADYSRYALVSALIATFGALIGATIIGMTRFAWGLELEGGSTELIAAADSNPWVFFSSRFTGITFPVGLIMLVVALKRNKRINTLLLVGLVVAIAFFPAGRIPKILWLNVVGDALMILGFGSLGRIYREKLRATAVSALRP